MSLQDSFILSSYSLSKHTSAIDHVYARSVVSYDDHVVITAQSDGVHILDSSAVHTVVSKTFGPSNSFACASVARKDDGKCRVYAAIEAAPGIPGEEHGRQLWSWSNDLDSGTAADDLSKVTLPYRIAQIHAPEELPTHLIVVYSSGKVDLLDGSLQVTSVTENDTATGSRFLNSFWFSSLHCDFIPPRERAAGSICLVTALTRGSNVALQIHCISSTGPRLLTEAIIPEVKSTLCDISLSASGILSVLETQSQWRSYTLSSTPELSLAPSTSFRLQGLTLSANTIALSQLTSSFVLLASTTSATDPELAIQIWDTQYSVIMASQLAPLPSALGHSSNPVKIRVAHATPSHAILVISPHLSDGQSNPTSPELSSTVLMVSLTVPSASTIAGALGRTAITAPWIRKDISAPSISRQSGRTGEEELVAAIQRAIDQKNADKAAVLFSGWTNAHPSAPLGRESAREILVASLQPLKTMALSYPAAIVHNLIQNKLVSSAMVEQGLLPILQLGHDWTGVLLAFQYVIDIPERDLVSLLQTAVAHARQQPTDIMDVDPTPSSSTAMPPLPQILAACVRYKTSPATLRLAFHAYLNDADDVIAVLDILDQWLLSIVDLEEQLGPNSSDFRKNEQGILVLLASIPTSNSSELPSSDQIASFLQTLLDASLVSLLQHAPAHRMLKRITQHLGPALEHAEMLATLQGPLAPFAQAQARAVRDGIPPGAKPSAQKGQKDWRQRRKAKHEQAALAVRVYQIEELVI